MIIYRILKTEAARSSSVVTSWKMTEIMNLLLCLEELSPAMTLPHYWDIHFRKKHFILLNIVTFDVVQVSVINSTIVIITDRLLWPLILQITLRFLQWKLLCIRVGEDEARSFRSNLPPSLSLLYAEWGGRVQVMIQTRAVLPWSLSNPEFIKSC